MDGERGREAEESKSEMVHERGIEEVEVGSRGDMPRAEVEESRSQTVEEREKDMSIRGENWPR